MLRAFLFLILIVSTSTHAYVSSRSTLSTGAYRDYVEKEHFVATLDWQLQGINEDGHETYIDLGVNNNLLQDQWRVYPQQLNIKLLFEKSTLQLGRQILTSGLYYTLFDGAQFKYILNPHMETEAFAGAVTNLEETPNFNTDENLFGASVRFFNQKQSLKLGTLSRYIEKRTEQASFLEFLLAKDSWMNSQWTTQARFNHQKSILEKAHLNWRLSPTQSFAFGFAYSRLSPDIYNPIQKSLWYRLTSSDKVQSYGAFQDIELSEEQTLSFYERFHQYRSLARDEEGKEFGSSLEMRFHSFSLIPSLSYIRSFGGRLIFGTLSALMHLNQTWKMKSDIEYSNYDKINGISANAYEWRGSLSKRFSSNLEGAASVELERNHYYALDMRGMLYVTHFAY